MQTVLSVLYFTFLFLYTAEAVGEKSFDSKIGCKINNDMTLVSGLKGSVYYYPWASYTPSSRSGNQNLILYTSKSYLSGGYIGDGPIITAAHSVYTKADVVNDVFE